MGVKLKAWGEFACFTRPEMKVERVSYDVITPSAARGILEAVYWKPEITWVIDRIHVYNEPRFMNIRRNEVSGKLPKGVVTKGMKDPSQPPVKYIEDDRQQRAAVILHDVEYIIEAHFETEDENVAKHLDQFNRRAARGQCHHRPYLGCKEFSARFAGVEGAVPSSPLKGERDLGWMLYDIDYQPAEKKDTDSFLSKEDGEFRWVRAEALFYPAKMKDGVIEVAELAEEVRR